MRLTDLLGVLDVIVARGAGDVPVDGVVCDSRKVRPGVLFAAVRGERHDGHAFLPAACRGGAVGVLSEHPPDPAAPDLPWVQVRDIRVAMAQAALAVYGRPDRSVPFIGVTGTNGKTTTVHLLDHLLRAAGARPAVLGTVGGRFMDRAIAVERTTPEAPDLLAVARDVVRDGGTHLLMEVSAHSLSLHRVAGVEFDLALFTNFSQDHLDYYGDMVAYQDAKLRLFDGRNAAFPRRALVNLDDPAGAEVWRVAGGEKWAFGQTAEADFRMIDPMLRLAGVSLTLVGPGGSWPVRCPLLGRGNLYNTGMALAAAVLLGLDPTTAAQAMADMPPVPGRMEEVRPGMPFRVVVDYAHKELALANACATLKSVVPGRLIVVFGCGGDRDRSKRPLMGRAAARLADVVVVTSDNPRTEDPEAIIEEIVPGIREIRPDFIREPDRRRAIRQAIGLAQPGDAVLLAGKGHETGQIVGHHVFPFDDRQVATEVLDELGVAVPGGGGGT